MHSKVGASNSQRPTSRRTAIRASTSLAYSALWNLDMGLPRVSAIFCIFDNFSVLPVAKYKKDSLSKFFVCW